MADAEPKKPDFPSPRPRRSRWRKRLAVYGSLYLAFLLLMTFGGCVDRIILHPSRGAIAPASATRREVATGPGQFVEVWSAPSAACRGPEPEGFVLAFIGNADRAEYALDRTAEQWAAHPVEIWAVNYPGFGGSTGGPGMKASAAAALAAYDALREKAGGRSVFVSGLSFGTAAALHVAANRPVAGLVLHNPPPLRQLILGRFGWWNGWLLAGPVAAQIPAELDSLANARRTTAPAVFLLAGADEVVPPAYRTGRSWHPPATRGRRGRRGRAAGVPAQGRGRPRRRKAARSPPRRDPQRHARGPGGRRCAGRHRVAVGEGRERRAPVGATLTSPVPPIARRGGDATM